MFSIFKKPEYVKGERRIDSLISEHTKCENIRFTGTLVVRGEVNGSISTFGLFDKSTAVISKGGKVDSRGNVKIGYVVVEGELNINGSLSCRKLVIKNGATVKITNLTYSEILVEVGGILETGVVQHSPLKNKKKSIDVIKTIEQNIQ
jgi:cytoskeletal protein CcmA (bactofilin family)